jgi:hypothetical protein
MSTNTGIQMLYAEAIIKCLIDWLTWWFKIVKLNCIFQMGTCGV